MAYKIFNKFLLIFIFLIIKTNLLANVVYDKNNIIISELDLKYYKQIHFEKYNEEINSSEATKNLVKIKKLINSLKKNNPDFLNKIDKKINIEFLSEFIFLISREIKEYNNIKNNEK